MNSVDPDPMADPAEWSTRSGSALFATNSAVFTHIKG